mmetsp:Transcript_16122/g.50689  ORF Transcript_16122/g.50689 Transcript_16122/m.50689 type:complete len:219 (+) Transcript_16122:573-1229(+)
MKLAKFRKRFASEGLLLTSSSKLSRISSSWRAVKWPMPGPPRSCGGAWTPVRSSGRHPLDVHSTSSPLSLRKSATLPSTGICSSSMHFPLHPSRRSAPAAAPPSTSSPLPSLTALESDSKSTLRIIWLVGARWLLATARPPLPDDPVKRPDTLRCVPTASAWCGFGDPLREAPLPWNTPISMPRPSSPQQGRILLEAPRGGEIPPRARLPPTPAPRAA